jgi:hypothetical protein
MIAYAGFGNGHRHGRKPLVNRVSCAAIADVADMFLIKSYLDSNKSNEHTQYARVGSIGIIGTFGNSRQRQSEDDMREKTLERKLVQAVKTMGGICPKFVSPGFDGMPDRLVLLPMGRIAFVEVKAMGSKPRPLQEARHGMLRRLGFEVYVLDDDARIQEILKEMGGDAK